MGPFEKHVFICTSGKVCSEEGRSPDVHARLKELVKLAGLESSIRVNHAGCMGQCGHGPLVVVYPDNVWYSAVAARDADEIFTEHLLGGRPVERLLYRPLQPGLNKKNPPAS